jgi:hypothetical protein
MNLEFAACNANSEATAPPSGLHRASRQAERKEQARTKNNHSTWENKDLGDHPEPAIHDHLKSGQ